ncbi:MAG: hypothetical protein ACE364_00515 [Chlorobiota bacterium]
MEQALIIEQQQGEFDGFPKNKPLVESISKERNIDEAYIGEFIYRGEDFPERGIFQNDTLYLDMSAGEVKDDSIYIKADNVILGKAIYLQRTFEYEYVDGIADEG